LLPRVRSSNDISIRLLSEPYQFSAFNHVRTALPGLAADIVRDRRFNTIARGRAELDIAF